TKIAIVVAIVAATIGYRAVEITIENRRTVFNIDRMHAETGVPVDIIVAQNKTTYLREPVAVRGGRIHVSGGRIDKFRTGMRLTSGGTITSVGNRIDLGTGMFVMRTSSPDGNHFVLMRHTGIFVPIEIVRNNSLMINDNGIATEQAVNVIASDATHAVIRGIENGTEIIITNVAAGTKIRGL
ncbi:MAG: hypothetical protein FWC83_02895, partial [Alphaproteobacteria bacterium]|nr:hypothetical protein [Alphaproteobacteria bacterium]